MIDWNFEKENLEKLIAKGIPYDDIGKQYYCSGGNIRKIARKLGIELPKRRAINPKEALNKRNNKRKYFCLNCGKDISNSKGTKHKYCSNLCQHEYEYKKWIEEYKKDNSIAKSTKWGQIPSYLRRYIFDKFENKCCICGWSEINPNTNTLPLEIDHIDGNSGNNSEDNLRLICPNCHSLTPSYRGANRGNGRNITWILKDK